MQAASVWVAAQWRQLRKDVWDDASIRPTAGILLTALVGLIVWLTIEYAPGAVARSGGQVENGSIDPFWGRLTIVFMVMATLAAGFEPVVTRQAVRWWQGSGRRWWIGLALPLRLFLFAPVAVSLFLGRLASFGWSFIDYLLARPIAIFAGAAWSGWVKRYAHFVALMIVAVGLSVLAEADRLAPKMALTAIVAGLVAILAVAAAAAGRRPGDHGGHG